MEASQTSVLLEQCLGYLNLALIAGGFLWIMWKSFDFVENLLLKRKQKD